MSAVIFLMSGYHLLNQYGCCHKYKIPPSLLETLLGHLEVGYHRNGNPYHNNLHATDVLQTTHWLISQTGVKDRLSDLEIFALLFSAIIHDYQHTGTTNNFHIQSNSSLAIMYNDRSVLENHHVAAFFRWKNTDFENLGFLTGRCWTMSATSCWTCPKPTSESSGPWWLRWFYTQVNPCFQGLKKQMSLNKRP